MFRIRRAGPEDVDAALTALGDAFARDPLMLHLFAENPDGVRAGVVEFFSILFAARLALDMPAYVLQRDDTVRGAVMGYDTSRPAWPAPIAATWDRFEAKIPGFAARLAAYEAICAAHQPADAHYYLGVIGLHPSQQGRGGGKAMLDTFCALSRADPASHGVYLDTANPASLRFYYDNGFQLRGEGRIGAAPLWCVYRRT